MALIAPLVDITTHSKTGTAVFLVYNADHTGPLKELIYFLESRKYRPIKLHEDIIPGNNVYRFIDKTINNESTPIIVYITADFEECRLCRYIREKLTNVVNSQENRVIPIVLPGTQCPPFLENISHVKTITEGQDKEKLLVALTYYIKQIKKAKRAQSNESEPEVHSRPIRNKKKQIVCRPSSSNSLQQRRNKDEEFVETAGTCSQENVVSIYKTPNTISKELKNADFLNEPVYYDMMKDLNNLADNVTGVKYKGRTFYSTCTTYIQDLEMNNKFDGIVLVLIKECGMAHYFGKYNECSAFLRNANSYLDKCENPDFLRARAKIYLSAIYREKKKFDESMNNLGDAKKILDEFAVCNDTAKLWYNEGKLYLTRIETAKPRSDCTLKQKAIHCFQQSADNLSYSNEVNIKERNRCLINIARLLAACPMTRAKQGSLNIESTPEEICKFLNLNESDIADAYGYLKNSQSEEASQRARYQQLCFYAEIKFADAMLKHRSYPEYKQLLNECIENLGEARDIASKGSYKEVEKINIFLKVAESFLRKTSVLHSCISPKITATPCTIPEKGPVYLIDSDREVQPEASQNASKIYFSGLEDFSDSQNSDGYFSDRK